MKLGLCFSAAGRLPPTGAGAAGQNQTPAEAAGNHTLAPRAATIIKLDADQTG